jgi:hypothetical protein
MASTDPDRRTAPWQHQAPTSSGSSACSARPSAEPSAQAAEPLLQALPRDLLRAHILEAVSLWDLGRLCCATKWLAEAVFADQKAWERRNGLLVGLTLRVHEGVLGATRAGKTAEACWTAILSAAMSAPRKKKEHCGPHCDAAWIAINIEMRRQERAAAVAARHGAPCALPPHGAVAGGRARAASIDAETSLDGFLEDAYALAALATPAELTQLISAGGGTARAVSLVATFLRVVDGDQIGLGAGIDALAPVAGDVALRKALRAAAAADNGYDYRCKVWDLGGLQLYRLRDAVRSSESSPRRIASGVLFFLERHKLTQDLSTIQFGDVPSSGDFLAGMMDSAAASQNAGQFVGFLEANAGRTQPVGVPKPVFQVRVTT